MSNARQTVNGDRSTMELAAAVPYTARPAAGTPHSPRTVFGVLPFRSLRNAKSRLSDRLTCAERHLLALDLLNRAIAAMIDGGVTQLAIVTLDAELAEAGLNPRAELLIQTHGGLNTAIRQGQDWAVDAGADALLVLLPDLPLIDPEDIQALIRAAGDGSAVIAPDRHGTGTNALLLSPPDAIMPVFGERSASRHRLALALADLPLTDVQRPGIHLDLDTPDDLAYLEHLGYYPLLESRSF
jgi:2-phospho-L-lactate/phosphoenolpyruvate guanylyltransferase